MNLIAGATGLVGSEICRLLGASGKPVRALVRETSNPEKVATLGPLDVVRLAEQITGRTFVVQHTV